MIYAVSRMKVMLFTNRNVSLSMYGNEVSFPATPVATELRPNNLNIQATH